MRRNSIIILTPLLLASPAWAQDEPPAAPPSTGEMAAPKRPQSQGGRNITAFDRPGQRSLGGYFAQEFTASSDGQAYFDQRQMVLQVSSYVHDKLFFNAEIEYEHGGDVSQGGEIKLEQAWGEVQFDRALNLRAGIQLIPVGHLNVFHDADFREATTRPLLTRQIIPSTWMEPGIGLRGSADATDSMEVAYEVYVTQGLTNQITPQDGLRKARPSAGSDNNIGKAVTGRVSLSPWLGLELGLGSYHAPYDPQSQSWLHLGALDVQWRHGPFELVAEGALVGTQGGAVASGDKTAAIPGQMGGYYVEGHYHFFPDVLEESILGRGMGFDQAELTAFGRWGQIDTDLATLTDDDRSEWVLGLNYRPVPNTALKLEWQRLQKAQSGGVTAAFVSSLAVGF